MKKNSWTLRDDLGNALGFDRDRNTEIDKESFEKAFARTDEKVTYTFMGWDGKSYDGESRTSKVLRCRLAGYEDFRFIKVGKGVHMIDEDRMEVEKATGIAHPSTSWVTDVRRG